MRRRRMARKGRRIIHRRREGAASKVGKAGKGCRSATGRGGEAPHRRGRGKTAGRRATDSGRGRTAPATASALGTASHSPPALHPALGDGRARRLPCWGRDARRLPCGGVEGRLQRTTTGGSGARRRNERRERKTDKEGKRGNSLACH